MSEPRSVKNTITGLAAAHMVTDIYMPVLPAILPLLIAQNGYSYLAADLREDGCRDQIGACDTVVMNPPFGAQKVHADRPFIDCALAVAGVTYSIFNAGSIPFVEAYTAQKAEITEKIGGAFPIQRTFAFHTKDVQEIEVEILRLKQIA